MKKMSVVVVLSSAGLWAQTGEAPKPPDQRDVLIQRLPVPPGGMMGMEAAMMPFGPPVTGAPYSAEAVTERIQTLPDGNRIVQSSTSSVARDGQGRTRRDESLGMALPGAAGPAPRISTIDDPVSGVHWNLDLQSKTASKMVVRLGGTDKIGDHRGNALFTSILPPPGPERTFFYSSGTPGSQITIQTMERRSPGQDPKAVRSDLGTQTVEGVLAHGTRMSRTLPAGEVGNEQPLIIVSETWYSPDLRAIVMSKSEDPRMGVTTYKLTNIQRTEPAASLFEVPPDFIVKDMPGNLMLFHDQKKP